MDKDRKKELDLVLRDIDKSVGKGIIKYGNAVGPKEQLPTGIKQIDEFLGGGWTIGNFSVIYGVQSCGKSTVALQTIANTQKDGKICCYVDLEHSLDETRARSLGVNWDELVVIDTAENAEQAMDAVVKLAKAEVVDFVVVDSIQAFAPKGMQETKKGKEKSIDDDTIALLARQLGKFFTKVSTPIFTANISVLLIGQVRTQGIGSFYIHDGLSGGKALLHWAYQTIYIRRGQNSDAPMLARKELFLDPAGKLHKVTKKDPAGFDCVCKMEKTKASGSASERSEIHVPFYTDCGFSEVIVQEEIPEIITGTEEEQEKIREMVVDKSIKKACKTLANDDKALTKIAEDYLGTGKRSKKDIMIDKEMIDKGKDVIKDFDYSKAVKVTPKKKRGRPAKAKKEKK